MHPCAPAGPRRPSGFDGEPRGDPRPLRLVVGTWLSLVPTAVLAAIVLRLLLRAPNCVARNVILGLVWIVVAASYLARRELLQARLAIRRRRRTGS